MSQLIVLFLINKFIDAVNEEINKSDFPNKSIISLIKDDLEQISRWISHDPSALSEVKTDDPGKTNDASGTSKAKTDNTSTLSKGKTDDASAPSKAKTDNTSTLSKGKTDDASAPSKAKTDNTSTLSKVKTDDASASSEVKTDDPSTLSKVKTDDASTLSKGKTDDASAPSKIDADKLREYMYSLDEILRECLMLSKKRKERGKICLKCYSPRELLHIHKFTEKLQKIKEYLHSIRTKIPKLEESIPDGGQKKMEKTLQWTSSAIDETRIYGWDNEVAEINKELVKENAALNKVGIVGMFGSGKSTLAQKIFVSEDVLDTFPLRLWVWVSPNCPKEEIVRRMLDNLGVEEEEIEKTLQIDPAMNKLGVLLFILYLQLLDKRYLIVFDDVLNLDGWYCNLQEEPPEDKEWYRLAHGLPKGNGSAIIITSRKEDDARKMVGKGKIYTPKPLIGDHGWTLFKSAFEEEANRLTVEETKALTVKEWEELKQEITIKCGGLPLALITAGKEMVHEKLKIDAEKSKIDAENVRQEMSQYERQKDKNPDQDGAQAEKQKAEATARDGGQAEKQKPEDTVTEEGAGQAVRDGAQSEKQKVQEAVAEEGSGHAVRDGDQDEKKKAEAEKKKVEDTVAEEGSGHAVRDGAQADKQKADDTAAEEGSDHAVRDGAQAEKQKADEAAAEEGSDG